MKTSHSFILVALVLLLIIWSTIIPLGICFNWHPIIYMTCAAVASILIVVASRTGYVWRKRVIKRTIERNHLIHRTGGAKPCPASSYVYQTRDCYNGSLTNDALKWIHPDNNTGCYNMSEALYNSEVDKCSQMPITTQSDLDLVDETHPIQALKMIALSLIGKAGDITKDTIRATENAVRRGEARFIEAVEESRSHMRTKMEPIVSAIDDTKSRVASAVEQFNSSDIVNNATDWLHGNESQPEFETHDNILVEEEAPIDTYAEPVITNAAEEFGISSPAMQEVEEEVIVNDTPVQETNEHVEPTGEEQTDYNIERLFETEESAPIKNDQRESERDWERTLE
jgi:hypothetical protein